MDFLERLKDLFPNKGAHHLNNVIDMVNEELLDSEDTEKLERMCTLLLDDYNDDYNNEDATGHNSTSEYDDSDQYEFYSEDDYNVENLLLKRFPDACPKYIKSILANNDVSHDFSNIVQQFKTNGYLKKDSNNTMKNEMKKQIKEIFPDICDSYLDKYILKGFTFDQLMDKFSNEDYVKQQHKSEQKSNVSTIHQHLCSMLPKFDPDFLYKEALMCDQSSEMAISECINKLLEMKEFPTIEQYNSRQARKNKMLSYIFHFKIDTFLKELNYSTDCFETPDRIHSLQNKANLKQFEEDKQLVEIILHKAYPNQMPNLINSMLGQYDYDIIMTCTRLGPIKKFADVQEKDVVLPQNSYENKLMFQELGYVINQALIMNYQKLRKSGYERAYKEAEATQQLKTCQCCYEEGLLLLPEECYLCRNDCIFCKECMVKGCEVAYGEGKLEIECFAQCGATFSDETLQMVMDIVAFTKLMQRKQIKEIREASVDGFETCPFCDYGTILPKEEKIFKCMNVDCGKESCRECRHVSHIPLRCNEIEYDEDVKLRTLIENEMSAALIRKCKKCGNPIIKSDGCNKMTCTCGQTMCYICGASGIDYNHFKEGNNGRCKTHTNQEDLHRRNVLDAVQRAKAQLGVLNNPNKLKFDPSENF